MHLRITTLLELATAAATRNIRFFDPVNQNTYGYTVHQHPAAFTSSPCGCTGLFITEETATASPMFTVRTFAPIPARKPRTAPGVDVDIATIASTSTYEGALALLQATPLQRTACANCI